MMKIEVIVKKVFDVSYDVDFDDFDNDFELLDELNDNAYRIEEEVMSSKKIEE